jgi:hypothetical protein
LTVPKPNAIRLPEHERKGLEGMRITLKAKGAAKPKAKAKPARKGRTHGQKCPHCVAHLRPLEPSVEQEQAQCIACDGWFKRTHKSVEACAPPKLKDVDPRLFEAMEEGREAREALALFEDRGPEPGKCALCERTDEGTKHEGPEVVVDAGSLEQLFDGMK